MSQGDGVQTDVTIFTMQLGTLGLPTAALLPPQGGFALQGEVGKFWRHFGSHNFGGAWLLASRGWKPGVLFNHPAIHRQHTTACYPSLKRHECHVEKP